MKSALLLGTLGCCLTCVPFQDKRSNKPDHPPKHIAISQLTPQHDGMEVMMTFTVESTFMISGTVPVGQVASFGIKPVRGEDSPSFYVLVSGDLANLMNRFDMVGPHEPSRGKKIEATGKVSVFHPRKDSPSKGPSYQLNIRDWKSFRVIPDPKPRRF